jgi:hypothetical protein
MSTPAESASVRALNLIHLTRNLTERLMVERDAFLARRPQDVAHGMAETQELANHYRRESAHVKASPDFIKLISTEDLNALIEATKTFEDVLTEHTQIVDAARHVSEGLVKAIASEVASARAQGTGYGASGRATDGDSRAVALNRMA